MGAFFNDLSVEKLPKKDGIRYYRLTRPFIVRRGNHQPFSPKDYVVVPAGYVTDGATIPRWLWGAIPPSGMTFRAAVVHDYLGWCLREGHSPHPGFTTQKAIDDFFLELMEDMHVPSIQRWAMYRAVRWVAVKDHL